MYHNDGRALSNEQLDVIQGNIFRGCYHDDELLRLFETIAVQRQILGELFKLFKSEPLRRVSTADAVANSQLAYFKERVSMDK